jgi:surfactin synthase thioesterase subunit
MLEPVMRADQAAISRFPTDAPPIGCLIDVVVGEQDPGFERLAPQEWARYTPRMRVLRLPYGHLLAVDHPQRCAEIVVQGIPDAVPATLQSHTELR